MAGRLALCRPGRLRPGRAAEQEAGLCLPVPSSLAGILRVGERGDAAVDRGNGAAPGPLASRGDALPRGARGADDAPAGRAVGRRAAALRRGARPGARPESHAPPVRAVCAAEGRRVRRVGAHDAARRLPAGDDRQGRERPAHPGRWAALRRLREHPQGLSRVGPAGVLGVLRLVRAAPAGLAAPAARLQPARGRALRAAGCGGRHRPAAPAARAQGAAPAGRRERKLRARRGAARPHPGAGMIDLSLLPDGGMGWLDASGPKGSIVLSTRIRLARNLEGYVFSQRAKDADRTAVLTRVEEASAASDLLQGAVTIRLDQLERVDRQLLHERHLVSKELAGLDREARPRPGAALVVQGTVGGMVNEEDHLRLHGMRSGFALEDAYADLEGLDADLGRLLPFPFHPEFGYLTSCPTNAR